ncbi:hypothetical protein [Brevibacillus laterosporus]|uniref:hypothetical protein n=1 Tax=Brevibacillus laterosporus TaxID=1465 RepID=UPI0018F86EBA|nr:hypothetical protein [Brevibacillus laterosporus]
MTHLFDDYSAPTIVRSLRYLREELVDVEALIDSAKKRCTTLEQRKQTITDGINDIERELGRIGPTVIDG